MRSVAALALLLLGSVGVDAAQRPRWALAVHGGAGNILPAEVPEAAAAEYHRRLLAALAAGEAILRRGGTSLDAVTACIAVLEDDPAFNAGRGAVVDAAGMVALDASIMSGSGRRAGAVAGVRRIRSPIRAARAVMEHSPHVLLSGAGAEALAARHGLELVDPAFFRPAQRRDERGDAGALPGDRAGALPASRLGTVGCVALDVAGHLAAGTSTGGTPGKAVGRIGDSPLIGAGTYAWNGVCAVSATGHGEAFIRSSAAHHVAMAIRYRDLTAAAAADETLAAVQEVGGSGGLIVIDGQGRIAIRFTSAGMFRAWQTADGEPQVAIFGQDRAAEASRP